MNNNRKIPGFNIYVKIHQFIVERIVWPYSLERDSLYRMRAHILTSLLIASFLLGSIALVATGKLIITKNAWGLAIVDIIGLILCFVLLLVHHIRFELRAIFTLLGFYIIGISVILSVGPISGGPAWLFTFAVLAGVIIGNKGALAAILLNTIFMVITCFLIVSGWLGDEFKHITSIPRLIATGVNFIVLNAITAISVSALVKGLFNIYLEKEELANRLQNERAQLIVTKSNLESEITDRKIAEREIWKLNQFRESIIDNANIWISVLDNNGNVIVWNKAAESISGYTKNQVVGHRKIWKWAYPDKNYRIEILDEILSIVDNKEVIEDYETAIQRSDGEKRIISWHGRYLIDDNSNKTGAIAIGRDITEHTLAEKEKEYAQKVAGEHKELALVGQVAGKMAHDFNNVLGIIMGNTELGLIYCKDENIEEKLKLILDQTLRGKNLTRNLVAFAKNQQPKHEYFKIAKKVDSVLNLLRNDLEGIEIIREDQPVPELLADPVMIEHSLMNLIQNSIHATGMKKNSKIFIKTYACDENIYIEIEDNGCGIPEEYLDQIYVPSFTLKGNNDNTRSYDSDIKGTGYGMSNVKKYINQHKGSISVESEFGKYTRFTISLPVIEKELTDIEIIDNIKKEKNHFEKRILIVEDEFLISKVLNKLLTRAPFRHKVDIAPNGRVGMDLFEKNEYDFVSLDYILPGNINGMDIYNYIRKTNKKIPILFLSGNIEFLESIKDLKQKDKILDHLSKPCPHKHYISSINRLFDKTIS
ncbi:MAG: PAS domain S-box protein [Desulfobacterales bacterium]|nr:PAS domain S-box protein [Desulfobacterales bacterium]